MADTPSTGRPARFDVTALAAAFPDTAATMLFDRYLTDTPAASARIFRIYRPTPPHYHVGCDEYLYCLSGRGTAWMERPEDEAPFGPGQLLFFARGTVHAMPTLLETPLVFLSVDTPRRDPTDIVFVDPADGTPAQFIQGVPATK